MEEEDPWNGGGVKGGAAEKPTRVAGASAAGRKDTGRSDSSRPSSRAYFVPLSPLLRPSL